MSDSEIDYRNRLIEAALLLTAMTHSCSIWRQIAEGYSKLTPAEIAETYRKMEEQL